MSLFSTFRWNCNLLPKFGKTQSHLINCVLFICSFFQLISNPINWILFFTYSIVKFHVALSLSAGRSGWWTILQRTAYLDASVKRVHYLFLPVAFFRMLVGLDGLEPSTSRLSGARSSHLSYRPVFFSGFFSSSIFKALTLMVEMKGIEPLTPCLQGRCSPSWATPPYLR